MIIYFLKKLKLERKVNQHNTVDDQKKGLVELNRHADGVAGHPADLSLEIFHQQQRWQ